MTRPQPTARPRVADPSTPRGARRIALGWVYQSLVGVFMVGLLCGAWNLAQVHHYEDNLRGFEYGDPFPWVAVLLCGLWAVVALVVSAVRWARYLRIRKQG